MSNYTIRPLRNEDYPAVASLLNLILSEPITAKQLQDEENSIPPGQLHYNDDGQLMGWDRPKWVAENEQREVIGYAIAWRAPWTEPGHLNLTLVVHPDERGRGAGRALSNEVRLWAQKVKASRLVCFMKDNDEISLEFAQRRGYQQERHIFESVLNLSAFTNEELFQSIRAAEQSGIRFITLADEPGEENERKLHELYRVTHLDIPGFNEDFPWFEEWRKWNIDIPGVRPEYIHIAKDGESYVGVVTLQQNEQTQAMYHQYTGILSEYRRQRLGLALKMLAIRTARTSNVTYLRTHNDSMNVPMLRINRDLLGFEAAPGNFKMVCKLF
ncbi:GNAT family N-acetyltransferase [Paenibacillus donghaensis]|uniref:GNAT family N-acetyltransferase n=1 Tax=Paenibacillus donghaensis TaxID=414771 RepID=UPI0018847648|nr:GNAT family N-acetyltransferase [Paenibacillus donghaensis]MBE9913808.1 GNAT family N-acetyltransferase [Paenibacillus donghaensis]